MSRQSRKSLRTQPMSHETWHLLIHRIPARPLYLRARIRSLLDRSGAVALKNSVYALPKRSGGLERLNSVAEEIRRRGGEAFVCESRFTRVDDEVALVEAFREAREADYRQVRESAEALRAALDRRASGTPPSGRLAKLERRLEWIRSVDFFAGEGAEPRGVKEAEASLRALARRLDEARGDEAPAGGASSRPSGRTWVTRRGVHVDRIACAWYIRRFVDPTARFRFVASGQGALRSGERGFDMPGAEFSHEEGRCSLETLIARTGKTDAALERISGIVHDIDLKDHAFGHPETAGVERLLTGILATHPGDEERLERGAMLFDDLYHSLRKPATFPAAGSKARGAPAAPLRRPKRRLS